MNLNLNFEVSVSQSSNFLSEFLDPSTIELYLKYNPKFLDDYVKVNVQREQVTAWLELKVGESEACKAFMGEQGEFAYFMHTFQHNFQGVLILLLHCCC